MWHLLPSADRGESHSPHFVVVEHARLLEILTGIAESPPTGDVISLFHDAVLCLGAESGVFLSCLRDDATRTSLRTLWACDPVWAAAYANQHLFEHDPWLKYASHDVEPARSIDLTTGSNEEEAFTLAAAAHGFASTLVAPAPSHVGLSRIGVLYLGSKTPTCFEGENFSRVRVLARALAMELHQWIVKATRQELLAVSGLTEADMELLRHEAAGHSSKAIGAALNLEAKTIDCRFQRVNAKLDAPDRRTAARIARLYGLV